MNTGGCADDIVVQYASQRPGLPAEADIRHWAGLALAGIDRPGELTIRIIDGEEGRRLNAAYRGRDYATNVLSFPFEAPPGMDASVLGDIAICAPVVAAEAADQGKTAEAHWAHMVVHGVLHLLGYDHKSEADAREMETLEVALLRRLGLPDPYGPPCQGRAATLRV